MKRHALAAAVFVTLLFLRSQAQATFHVIVIDEVFFGFAQAPEAQYVVLRMEAPLQTLVHGQPLPTFDASGGEGSPFATFCTGSGTSCDLPAVSPACAAGGCPSSFNANGRRVLIATPRAQELFCITPDLLASGTLPHPDGRVCWGECAGHPDCPPGPVDCVAYGSFTGNNGIFGTPAMTPALGDALVGSPDRQNQFAGGNLLDNAVGFSVQTATPLLPTPQNFHADVGGAGLAGDPQGTGVLGRDEIDAEVPLLFAAEQRCDLPAANRGADANLDTRLSAADVVATIQIVAAAQ